MHTSVVCDLRGLCSEFVGLCVLVCALRNVPTGSSFSRPVHTRAHTSGCRTYRLLQAGGSVQEEAQVGWGEGLSRLRPAARAHIKIWQVLGWVLWCVVRGEPPSALQHQQTRHTRAQCQQQGCQSQPAVEGVPRVGGHWVRWEADCPTAAVLCASTCCCDLCSWACKSTHLRHQLPLCAR